MPAEAYDARLTRLAGDGTSTSGGGFALPDVLRSIFQHLLDNNPVDKPGVYRSLIETSLHGRRDRVKATWSDWDDPWTGITEDLLFFLKEGDFLRSAGGRLVRGPALTEGQELTVLPARPGKNTAVRVVVYSREERDRRGFIAEAEMHLRAARRSLVNAGVPDENRLSDLIREMMTLATGSPKVTIEESQEEEITWKRPRDYLPSREVHGDRPPKPEIDPEEILTCPVCEKEKPGIEFPWEWNKNTWRRRFGKCPACRAPSRHGKTLISEEMKSRLMKIKEDARSQGLGKGLVALTVARAALNEDEDVSGIAIADATDITKGTMSHPMTVAKEAEASEIDLALRKEITLETLIEKYARGHH